MKKEIIPRDVVLGLPVVTIVGNSCVHIENYKKIVEINSQKIRVETKKGVVVITGKGLVMSYYNDCDLSVEGFIQHIEL